ncbi:unnamed protein product [Staurois parvus]|uniref:Uncharacterized protein n=1 Tax=Staurois parvus TaxID=386267 RepID=A0ABN9AEQ3_9NEOB|nr:unnamed protein product [Staurois parvus]
MDMPSRRAPSSSHSFYRCSMTPLNGRRHNSSIPDTSWMKRASSAIGWPSWHSQQESAFVPKRVWPEWSSSFSSLLCFRNSPSSCPRDLNVGCMLTNMTFCPMLSCVPSPSIIHQVCSLIFHYEMTFCP